LFLLFIFPLFSAFAFFFSFYPPSMNFLLQQVETVPGPGHYTAFFTLSRGSFGVIGRAAAAAHFIANIVALF
jgi:hypothetical protein